MNETSNNVLFELYVGTLKIQKKTCPRNVRLKILIHRNVLYLHFMIIINSINLIKIQLTQYILLQYYRHQHCFRLTIRWIILHALMWIFHFYLFKICWKLDQKTYCVCIFKSQSSETNSRKLLQRLFQWFLMFLKSQIFSSI